MNSFHKIFFVGVVILSVAMGSYFNGAGAANGDKIVSAIASKTDPVQLPEAPQLAQIARAATSNDSTTSNDIKAGDEPDVLGQSNDEDSKTVLDNGALLKADISSIKDAFRLIGSTSLTAGGSKQLPEIQAEAAILADLKTGRIYFQSNQNIRWPAASLTELMSAAMALKNMDLNQPLKIGEGTNSSYSGSDVVAAMLLTSNNETAEILANAYGRDNFIAGLNSLAVEFGMSSTNFSDPSGLSVSNQSTAADFQKLALAIYRDHPKIFDITGKKSATVKELDSKKKIKLSNENNFAGTAGFIGGKTGYSDDANSNILSVFSYAGRPVLVIILGADDGYGETNKLMDWFKGNYK